MKKKDIIFWWVVVIVGLFISYKIVEYQWKCHEGVRKYENEMRNQGHKLSTFGHMLNEYQ